MKVRKKEKMVISSFSLPSFYLSSLSFYHEEMEAISFSLVEIEIVVAFVVAEPHLREFEYNEKWVHMNMLEQVDS